jgi:dolichol-phosphate mannosyltransferase
VTEHLRIAAHAAPTGLLMATERISTDASPPPELSVVVPTYNERDNVARLVRRLRSALDGIRWEIIFVDDDSPDGTTRVVRALTENDGRIRCIRRVHRRGLSGACIEGILAASGAVVAVIDADLQHDEAALPQMLERVRHGADLVVGTRFGDGAGADGGLTTMRLSGSLLANTLARRLLGVRISDPMSGFFMLRRSAFDDVAPHLSTQGFKVLLDIVASSRSPLAIAEVPYQFRPRQHGASKLDSLVVIDYLGLLLAKVSGDRLSVRFVLFALVGASGLLVHLAALRGMLDLTQMHFDWAQTAAAYIAMTWNFALNNRLTYRDRRLRGWAALKGLASFYLVCSVGAVANVGVASWLYQGSTQWWLAGTAGALMGAVFNYAATSALTWRQR